LSLSNSKLAGPHQPRKTNVLTLAVPSSATVASCSQRAWGDLPSFCCAARNSWRQNGLMINSSSTLLLVYDGGCPFCQAFAARAELVGGIPSLTICDGRADHKLRAQLLAQGFDFGRGAALITPEKIWHGSDAVAEISKLMKPSDPLLLLLKAVFMEPARARRFYPILLLARRIALGFRGLPVFPPTHGEAV